MGAILWLRRARRVFPLLEALPEAETEGFIFNIFCFVHWKKKKEKGKNDRESQRRRSMWCAKRRDMAYARTQGPIRTWDLGSGCWHWVLEHSTAWIMFSHLGQEKCCLVTAGIHHWRSKQETQIKLTALLSHPLGHTQPQEKAWGIQEEFGETTEDAAISVVREKVVDNWSLSAFFCFILGDFIFIQQKF